MNKNTDSHGFVNKDIDEYGIARIVFGNSAHNAFSSFMLKTLAAYITELGKDPAVNVILIKSQGENTFCAGASFDELMDFKNESDGKMFFSGFAYVINAIRLCKKIVVGQVQGKAIGGGVGLAAACDYCFAIEQALIRLSELGINIGPFVIGPVVKRKIGLASFTELTFNPDQWRDAQWAKEKGLFQEVFLSYSELENAVDVFCRKLASVSPEVLKTQKLILWENTNHWDALLLERASLSGKLVVTDEAKTSLRAFKERN